MRLVEFFLGLAMVIQTLELMRMRALWSDRGIWRWPDLREEYGLPFVRSFLDLFLSAEAFRFVLVLRFVSAIFIMNQNHLLFVIMAFVSTLLIMIRWRGSLNGGSDFMTVVILLAVLVDKVFPENPLVHQGALYYIAIQSSLSYVISGLRKLPTQGWWTGRELKKILSYGKYLTPHAFKDISLSKTRVLSWVTLFFELSFPLAFLSPKWCIAYLSAGFLFHLVNVRVFGLNRFFHIWIATYPAVFILAQARSNNPF
jgi:hypothetical protein